MNKSWILIFLVFCALLARIHCQSTDNMEGMEGLDDDDDEDYDDTAERQLGGSVRDAVRNFVSGTVKYITNTRLIPSVVSQAFRRPGAAAMASGATGAATAGLSGGSAVGNAAANAAAAAAASAVDGGMAMSASNAIETAANAAGSALSGGSMASPIANSLANFNALLPISTASNQIQQASEFLGNVFRTMRSNWARRNQEQQQELRKRLSAITKRLTSSRVVLGTLHRLTGREDTEQSAPVVDVPSTGDLKTSESKTQQTIAQEYPQLIPVPYFAPF